MDSQWNGRTWLDAWTKTSSQMLESVAVANRATLTALGFEQNSDIETESEPQIDPAGDLPEWETNSTAETRAELEVGDRFSFTKTLTDKNVRAFALASGDTNPLHLDDEFAEQTRFEERIVHGTLVGGLISAALARMPGLVVYLSQDLNFRAPVRIGERVTADCEIIEDLGDDQYRLETRVHRNDTTIIDGEAVVLVDELPS